MSKINIDHAKICEMISNGHKYDYISSELSISISTISKISKKYGIKSCNRVCVSPQQELEIISLYKDKTPITKITQIYGIHRTTILKILKRHKIKAQNYNIILNAEQVDFIKNNYALKGGRYCGKVLGVSSRIISTKACLLQIKRIIQPSQKDSSNRLRALISRCISKSEMSKRTQSMVGCNLDEFIIYIESLFHNGMNWNNYRSIWEIDHIKPLSLFDLTNKENYKICNHYTNLQPLWVTTKIARDNGDYNSIGNRNKGNDYDI